MKTSKIIAAAALAVLAAAGAQAETYEGVHQLTHSRARADVAAEATVAARAGNVYGEGLSLNVAPVLTASVDRSVVRAEAVAAAHAPNQNLDRKAFVNSVVPTQYTNGSLKIRTTRQAAL
ncbi:MAG: alpha/beta hydrolase [Variovorax sp.]|jgi:acyl CoA:acetate/3-ketoacid CoA transferase alpha subunit|nr:MAG: alpha/beta hydrolase [Variovorax sp.]